MPHINIENIVNSKINAIFFNGSTKFGLKYSCSIKNYISL